MSVAFNGPSSLKCVNCEWMNVFHFTGCQFFYGSCLLRPLTRFFSSSNLHSSLSMSTRFYHLTISYDNGFFGISPSFSKLWISLSKAFATISLASVCRLPCCSSCYNNHFLYYINVAIFRLVVNMIII